MKKRTIHLNLAVVVLLAGICPADNSGSKSREPIKDVGARYGFSAPAEVGNNITFKSKYTTMAFETNSRKLLFNGVLIWMNSPIVKKRGRWTITKADVIKVIDPLLRAETALNSVGLRTVVIDPGHGGEDPGAIGRRKVYEKKVVLDIARRVRRKLQDNGISVKLTREKDTTLGLVARTVKARLWNADVFVSVHLNSAHNSAAAGMETYVVPAAGFPSTAGNNDKKSYPGNKFDKANTVLAYYVHKAVLAHTKSADRGIRRARFDVIRYAHCPAIMVECGFVSNKAEEEKMLKRGYRESLAQGIADGILTYIKRAKSAQE